MQLAGIGRRGLSRQCGTVKVELANHFQSGVELLQANDLVSDGLEAAGVVIGLGEQAYTVLQVDGFHALVTDAEGHTLLGRSVRLEGGAMRNIYTDSCRRMDSMYPDLALFVAKNLGKVLYSMG